MYYMNKVKCRTYEMMPPSGISDTVQMFPTHDGVAPSKTRFWKNNTHDPRWLGPFLSRAADLPKNPR